MAITTYMTGLYRGNIRATMLPLLLLFLISGSCSQEQPANIEPIITALDAAEITRNEATVGAKVELRGSGKLSSFRFRYGDSESMESTTRDITPMSSEMSIRLTGLKPGTTYYFCGEGENSGSQAVIRSRRLSFRTEPNTVPTVTETATLSSGPTGIITGFTISDNGGDMIIDAGCDVTDSGSSQTVRHSLPQNQISTGEKRIYIGGLLSGHEYKITPFAKNAIGESFGESITFSARNSISLHEAGQLETVIGSEKVSLETLVISGKMNGADFHFLRKMLGAPLLTAEMPSVNCFDNVDISDVTVVEGGSPFNGSHYTENNVIVTRLFADCVNLKNISLPATATAVRRDAFLNCEKLETIEIPANAKEVGHSSGCASLRSIDVSSANEIFKSVDGVLFNSAATEILWFPLGKEGEFSIPETMTDIGENALRGARITSLKLPNNLKSLGRGAFSESSLVEISIPDGITNIPEALFQGCSDLKTVRIGNGIRSIGSYAFIGCPLMDLYIESEFPPVVNPDAFSAKDTELFSRCVLHVHAGSAKLYRNHAQWKSFVNITEEK